MSESQALREAGARQTAGPVSVAVVGLFVLAIFYTLHFAAALLLPIAFALLLASLLAPIVERAAALGIPRFVSAFVLVGLLVAATSVGVYSLSGAAAEWLRAAPTNINEARERFEGLDGPLADVRQAAEAVEDAVDDIAGQSGEEPEQTVQLQGRGWLEIVIARIPVLVGGFAVAMVLTIFLLTWANDLALGLAAMQYGFGARRRTLAVIQRVQRDVSRYLGTVTRINVLLGMAVWLALLWVGMPNAPLWGTVAGVANFAPYIGPACTAIALLFAGATTFDTWQSAAVPSLVFFAITALEGQLITPAILGRRLAIPPPIVFTAVFLFGWLWGVVGALIAVPIVVVLKRLRMYTFSQRKRRVPSASNSGAYVGQDSKSNVIALISDSCNDS